MGYEEQVLREIRKMVVACREKVATLDATNRRRMVPNTALTCIEGRVKESLALINAAIVEEEMRVMMATGAE